MSNLEVPQLLASLSNQLFGVTLTEIKSLDLQSALDPKPMLVRVDVESDDGKSASLDYVDWRVVRTGSKELKLSNEDQPIPIRVTMTVNAENQKVSVELGSKTDRMSANWAYRLGNLRSCMAKPCSIRISLLDTGRLLHEVRGDGTEAHALGTAEIEVLADMAAVETQVGIPIYMPNRRLTDDEWDTINELRAILHQRVLKRKWQELAVPCRAETAANIVEAFAGSQVAMLGYEAPASVELFDTELPLGNVRLIYEEAKLTNEQEVRNC